MGLDVQWRSTSFVLKLPDLFGSRQRLTLLVVNRSGEVYVGWLKDQQ